MRMHKYTRELFCRLRCANNVHIPNDNFGNIWCLLLGGVARVVLFFRRSDFMNQNWKNYFFSFFDSSHLFVRPGNTWCPKENDKKKPCTENESAQIHSEATRSINIRNSHHATHIYIPARYQHRCARNYDSVRLTVYYNNQFYLQCDQPSK